MWSLWVIAGMRAAIVRVDLFDKLYCTVLFEGHIVLVPWLMYSAVLLCVEHRRFCPSALEYTQICHLKLCLFSILQWGHKDACAIVINTKLFKPDWEYWKNVSAATEKCGVNEQTDVRLMRSIKMKMFPHTFQLEKNGVLSDQCCVKYCL